MRKKLLFLLPLVAVIAAFTWYKPSDTAQAKPAAPTYRVLLHLTTTQNYCGGAAPSQEMVAELSTPKPFANKVMYLRKGGVNSTKGRTLIKLKTDSSGTIFTRLKPGTYCLIFPTQVNRPDTNKFKSTASYQFQGKECLDRWWATCWQVITVKNKHVEATYNLHYSCFSDPIEGPCMSYQGPYPP